MTRTWRITDIGSELIADNGDKVEHLRGQHCRACALVTLLVQHGGIADLRGLHRLGPCYQFLVVTAKASREREPGRTRFGLCRRCKEAETRPNGTLCVRCERLYHRERGDRRTHKQGPRPRKEADPSKLAARNAVRYALGTGTLVKPGECSVCHGSEHRIEAHHPDYSKRLEVVWLCAPCHKKVHWKE